MTLLDYDGHIANYDAGGGVPASLKGTIWRVKDLLSDPWRGVNLAVEFGAGNCIVAAEIAKVIPTIAVDISRVPRAQGDYELCLVDATTAPFFALLGPDVLLYSRRTQCLVLSDEWLASVAATGCWQIYSEALDNEDQRFRNRAVEAKFLQDRGWRVRTYDSSGPTAYFAYLGEIADQKYEAWFQAQRALAEASAAATSEDTGEPSQVSDDALD